MNFNKDRFANFAKYDLTINKAFYRNIAFVTLAAAVSIALLGFVIRYNIYTSIVNDQPYLTIDPNGIEGYNWMYTTAIYELGLIGVLLTILAGCWAHNLRSKQGRITELTLPATNQEKFIWHTLVVLVGGCIVCLLSLLVADGFNALLTLICFGTENGITSLTASVFEIASVKSIMEHFINAPLGFGDIESPLVSRFYNTFTFFFIATFIIQLSIYFFANSLKYKFNIILTYIALQILSTIGSILFFIYTAFVEELPFFVDPVDEYTSEDRVNNVCAFFGTIGGISIILAILFIWWSYKRYTKAQITSPFNK